MKTVETQKIEHITLANFNQWLDQSAKEWDQKLEEERRAREEDRKRQEAALEADRRAWEESHKRQEAALEAERKAREESQKAWEISQKAWDARMADLDKRLGKVTNSLGEIVEHLVTPNVMNKFKTLGFTFTETTRRHEVTNRDGKVVAELDVEFHNGQDVMIVEVKTQPTTRDVGRFAKVLEMLRTLGKFPGQNLYGAIAGAVFSSAAKEKAIKYGFYVLEQSGDTVQIVPAITRDKARVW